MRTVCRLIVAKTCGRCLGRFQRALCGSVATERTNKQKRAVRCSQYPRPYLVNTAVSAQQRQTDLARAAQHRAALHCSQSLYGVRELAQSNSYWSCLWATFSTTLRCQICTATGLLRCHCDLHGHWAPACHCDLHCSLIAAAEQAPLRVAVPRESAQDRTRLA